VGAYVKVALCKALQALTAEDSSQYPLEGYAEDAEENKAGIL
jgi:hypothetical protein